MVIISSLKEESTPLPKATTLDTGMEAAPKVPKKGPGYTFYNQKDVER